MTESWSIMIPAWNAEDLLGETLESVLAASADLDTVHIEVVDDASTDGTADVARRFAPNVGYWRQPENVGAIANFNTCLERAIGKIVHIVHADDLVEPLLKLDLLTKVCVFL